MLVSTLSGVDRDLIVSCDTSSAEALMLEKRHRTVIAAAAATNLRRKGVFADCMSLSFVSFCGKRSSRQLRVIRSGLEAEPIKP